ncbi:MAG: PadR family transcriptional regulator [Patescibacteria group bacterium]|jgi:transcriptional regulator
MKIHKELLKGSLDIMVLAVLKHEPLYGYQIVKELKNKSKDVFTLGEGTLYPLLHKLATAGLLESWWREVEGRRRKYYELTSQGKKLLEEKTAEWEAFSHAVDNVL